MHCAFYFGHSLYWVALSESKLYTRQNGTGGLEASNICVTRAQDMQLQANQKSKSKGTENALETEHCQHKSTLQMYWPTTRERKKHINYQSILAEIEMAFNEVTAKLSQRPCGEVYDVIHEPDPQ